MSKIIIFIIRLYQAGISPVFPASCRYYPSCSQYCIDAITKYGVIKGLFKGIGRILRCHPFHRGGCDPA